MQCRDGEIPEVETLVNVHRFDYQYCGLVQPEPVAQVPNSSLETLEDRGNSASKSHVHLTSRLVHRGSA